MTSQKQFQNILDVIDELEDTTIIFTKANSDTDGRIINLMIDNYVRENVSKSICFTSLGQIRYLSALKFVDAMVGNSSSGLLEAPSFKIATINIGDRQKGRLEAKSVINTSLKKEDIGAAFKKIYTQEFQDILKDIKNPYENGSSSKKIIKVLKKINLTKILKKKFYDLTKQ